MNNYKLTPELIYLIETLKVEGYWSCKHYTACIQNKNIPFLNYLEEILRELDLKIYKRILMRNK